MELSEDQLRRVVFDTSVAYHDALQKGRSIQESEWTRTVVMLATLEELGIFKGT
jgi:hypothetical protein